MDQYKNVYINNVKLRYFTFFIICFGYFSYGLNLTLIGISLQDITSILNTDNKNVSYGITIRFVINCLSALIASFSFKLFSRQFQYGLALLTYGLITIFLPKIKSLTIYFIASATLGTSSAFIDCVTNIWVFELFSENINFHVLIVHFSYSIGQIITPLLYYFLIETKEDEKDFFNQTNLINFNDKKIQLPFTICGSSLVIVAVLVFSCYFIKPYIEPKRSIDNKDIIEIENDEIILRKKPLPSYYYYIFYIIASIILGLEIANELNLNFYLPTYLNRSSLSVDRKTVNLIISVIGLSYSIGRFINIFISLKVDVVWMLYFNLFLILTGNFILTFIASNTNYFCIWFSIILLGLGYSSTFPCLFSFIEQRITITNTSNSILVFFTSLVFTLNTLVIGDSIDASPNLFQYINSFYSLAFIILFIILHSTDFWKKNLLKNSRV